MKNLIWIVACIITMSACEKEDNVTPEYSGQYHLKHLTITYLSDTTYDGDGNEFLYVYVFKNEIKKTIFKNIKVSTDSLSPYFKNEQFKNNKLNVCISDTFQTQYFSNFNPNYRYYFYFEKSTDPTVDSLINL